jgi:hypothetical protein
MRDRREPIKYVIDGEIILAEEREREIHKMESAREMLEKLLKEILDS